MSVEATPEGGRRGGLEVRSIDYVPLNERHGKLWHLGPLWFMSNAQIATLAVGVISVSAGGNLIWSLLAILLGVVIGTFFMAAHCAQGPQLGLPQMIQSRPQFGYVGAILVWLFAYLQYAGFNVFNTLLGRRRRSPTGLGSSKLWLVVGTAARGGGRDLRLRPHPQDGAGADLRLPAAVRHPHHRRAHPATTRPARSTSATSTWRRSCCSSPSWPATRSAGRSTSRTTRATCRPT